MILIGRHHGSASQQRANPFHSASLRGTSTATSRAQLAVRGGGSDENGALHGCAHGWQLVTVYLVAKGVTKQRVPHSHLPQANPAERQLQTFFRRILVITLSAQLPNWLWYEIAEAVNRVFATLPLRGNPNWASPEALITGKTPTSSYSKVIGCLGYVYGPASSLKAKAAQGTVVGYARESVGLRVLIAGVHFRGRQTIV